MATDPKTRPGVLVIGPTSNSAAVQAAALAKALSAEPPSVRCIEWVEELAAALRHIENLLTISNASGERAKWESADAAWKALAKHWNTEPRRSSTDEISDLCPP